MTAVRTLSFLGVTCLGLGAAVEVSSTTCGLNGFDSCPQQHRGQAMLQHHAGAHQQVGTELEPKQQMPHHSTAYVQVGVSGISLPPQLAVWTNGSAGLLQLREKARQQAAFAKTSPPEPGPVPISQWIADTLIPQAQLTIQQLNTELEGAWEEVNQCTTNRQQAEEGIADDKTFLSSSESRRSECEATSATNHKAAVARCQELKDFYMDLTAPVPTLKNMVAQANYSNDQIFEQMGAVVNFYVLHEPTFETKKGLCQQASGIDAHLATECLEDRRGIERSFCSLTKAQMDICSDYRGCYQEKAAAFDKVKADVDQLETHVKDNFKAMSCWNMEGDPTCEPNSVAVDHLNVIGKDKPAIADCSSDIGTSWDYSHVECPELQGFGVSANSSSAPSMI